MSNNNEKRAQGKGTIGNDDESQIKELMIATLAKVVKLERKMHELGASEEHIRPLRGVRLELADIIIERFLED